MSGEQREAPAGTAGKQQGEGAIARAQALRAEAITSEERPGDPVCLLRRVCPACGAVADTDPPTVCPQCGSNLPAG